MKEWFTPAEFAALKLPFTPHTKKGVNDLADKSGWRMPHNEFPANVNGVWRKRDGRGGGFEYRAAVLGVQAQAKLSRILTRQEAPPAQPAIDHRDDLVRTSVWDAYSRANDRLKKEAKRRLDALFSMQELLDNGQEKIIAAMITAKEFGVSERTLWNWSERTYGRPRADWLAYLVPQYAGRRKTAECDDDAFDALKTLYLRSARPNFTDCFRLLQAMAKDKGWKLPSAKTLQRKINALAETTKVKYREGDDALKRLYPAQERDKSTLHAMEAINGDTHKFDVFVQWPDGTKGRPALVAFQDLHSGKFVGWRIAREETAHAVLLAFGDVVETYGVPDRVVLDNGRAFAGKWLSGQTPTRYRFKVKPDDPAGVFKILGVQVHWTQPYAGQSKPIERGFRDFAQSIAKDPRFDGAWTGNTVTNKPHDYGRKAIPIDVFEAVVVERIAEHNARPGRRSKVCAGNSFDEAFAVSYQNALVKKILPGQKDLWLLASEAVTVRKQDGSVKYAGNSYWHPDLLDLRERKVVLRFDPDALHESVRVYRLDGVFIAVAECKEAVGFFSEEAKANHNRARKLWLKGEKMKAEAERGSVTLDDIHAMLPKVDAAEPPESKVVRPIFGRGGGGAAVAIQEDREFEREETLAAFGRGLRLVQTDEGADE